jgi:beta-glucosidase
MVTKASPEVGFRGRKGALFVGKIARLPGWYLRRRETIVDSVGVCHSRFGGGCLGQLETEVMGNPGSAVCALKRDGNKVAGKCSSGATGQEVAGEVKEERTGIALDPMLSLMGFVVLSAATCASALGQSGTSASEAARPWMDKNLSADRRAELLVAQMTLDEKIGLVHGYGTDLGLAPGTPAVSNGGAGRVGGIPRLGIPAIQMANATTGVARGAARGRYSTPLPSTVAEASTWDLDLACEYGALIGRELRNQGYTMSLGGGVNLAREPRDGRTFEYKGEDPILAGKLAAREMKCLQANGIMGDIKHLAVNDQETGRRIGNAVMDKRVLRETDLLAFEIALRETNISSVMCSYNKVNGDWACENQYLLNDFLKGAAGFKGFVVSDWGGTHSTAKAVSAGLDMEQPGSSNLGDKLKGAVQSGEVAMARLDDMVKRILRSQIAVGQFDTHLQTGVPDVLAGLEFAQKVAERGAVLLKNSGGRLPLDAPRVKSIAVIGSHADAGVLSGGGSAQVDPPGGNAVRTPERAAAAMSGVPVWYSSSPLKAIRAKTPNAQVQYNDGSDPAAAAALARSSGVAIVFVNQPASEGRDLPGLSLPGNQDKLVAEVAAANPRTIVVLETGGVVTMPWIDSVSAVLAAWYPGIRGGEAIANILFGDVNPSGKTPLTFPKSEADLPHQAPFGPPDATSAAPEGGTLALGWSVAPFDMPYTEGLKVGYKWYDAEGKTPLFAFGHGLSYTTFAYSGLRVEHGYRTTVSLTVRNTGKRAGVEIAQVYVSLPASSGEPPKRLVAWQPVDLKPGQSKAVTLTIDPLHLSVFNTAKDSWELPAGEYKFWAGGSSRSLPLSTAIQIAE